MRVIATEKGFCGIRVRPGDEFTIADDDDEITKAAAAKDGTVTLHFTSKWMVPVGYRYAPEAPEVLDPLDVPELNNKTMLPIDPKPRKRKAKQVAEPVNDDALSVI